MADVTRSYTLGIIYDARQDIIVLATSDGSFHVVRTVCTSPQLNQGPPPGAGDRRSYRDGSTTTDGESQDDGIDEDTGENLLPTTWGVSTEARRVFVAAETNGGKNISKKNVMRTSGAIGYDEAFGNGIVVSLHE